MDYIKIGFITKPHSYKGAVKILPLTSDLNRFKNLKKIYINFNGTYIEEDVQNIKIGIKNVVIKFKGYNNLDEAEKIKSLYIYIDRNNAIPLNEGEYYSQDLVGSALVYNNKTIGEIIDIENFGSCDLFVVSYNNQKTYYPFLKKYIESIDLKNKKIIINQFEGFFD